MYSFPTLQKNPAKVGIQTQWSWLIVWRRARHSLCRLHQIAAGLQGTDETAIVSLLRPEHSLITYWLRRRLALPLLCSNVVCSRCTIPGNTELRRSSPAATNIHVHLAHRHSLFSFIEINIWHSTEQRTTETSIDHWRAQLKTCICAKGNSF